MDVLKENLLKRIERICLENDDESVILKTILRINFFYSSLLFIEYGEYLSLILIKDQKINKLNIILDYDFLNIHNCIVLQMMAKKYANEEIINLIQKKTDKYISDSYTNEINLT